LEIVGIVPLLYDLPVQIFLFLFHSLFFYYLLTTRDLMV
jgi:hypothetical protein